MALEQFGRVHVEHTREPFDRVQRRRIDLALKRRNVSPIDACEIGKLLLRQLVLGTYSAQVQSEDLPQRHALTLTPATTLHPRSILYTNVMNHVLKSVRSSYSPWVGNRFPRSGLWSLTAVGLLAAAACSPSADDATDTPTMNLSSFEGDGTSGGQYAVEAARQESAAYSPVGIIDRVDLFSEGGIRSYVWLDSDEGTVVVDLIDDSATQLKSGQQVTFACGSVGLTQVGTTTYTRNAKEYTDCAIAEIAEPKEANEGLAQQHKDAELGRALDSMATQGSALDQ